MIFIFYNTPMKEKQRCLIAVMCILILFWLESILQCFFFIIFAFQPSKYFIPGGLSTGRLVFITFTSGPLPTSQWLVLVLVVWWRHYNDIVGLCSYCVDELNANCIVNHAYPGWINGMVSWYEASPFMWASPTCASSRISKQSFYSRCPSWH